MSESTGIQWTEATWNTITGCSAVSPGCANCYAAQLTATRRRKAPMAAYWLAVGVYARHIARAIARGRPAELRAGGVGAGDAPTQQRSIAGSVK